jgi:hypothetical protein
MNTIGPRVASGVTGSVNGLLKPGQTNKRKKQDDEICYVGARVFEKGRKKGKKRRFL